MTIERLERVMWRLRKNKKPNRDHLHDCIMRECGTDPITIKNNVAALKKLKWIVFSAGKDIELTGSDLNES